MKNRFIKISNLYKISNINIEDMSISDTDFDEDFKNWNEISSLYEDTENLKIKWSEFYDKSEEVNKNKFSNNFYGFSKWIDENLPSEMSFIDGVEYLIEKIVSFTPRKKQISGIRNQNLIGIPEYIKEIAQTKELQQPFDYNRWKEEIGKIESGGNYKAINKSTNALGKYQFVPYYFWKKIKAFSGNTVNKYSDFLNNPKLQEDFMKHYTFNELLNTLKSFRDREKKDLPFAGLLSDGKLMALFHFQGARGASNWLKTGRMEGADINISVLAYLRKIT